jgi:mono/diheme cytochrome c family protein
MRRSWLWRTLLLLLLVGGGLAAFSIWALKPPIPLGPSLGVEATSPLVAKGAELAAIGNCNVCHTKPDGPPYAGGRGIATPFGTVHSTNITPDQQTGIGGWTEAAFTRAMRQGVSRDGWHLYPAFPYDHMAKMHSDDIKAVYAFIMTRRPVHAVTPPNDLAFPFNIRALVAGWKLLFLDRAFVRTDPNKSAEWNRGAYLVEGLGHCGACHTPRNILGAEKQDQAYAGGESDGWIAPALNASSTAAVPWTAERLHAYLRSGFHELHGIAAGPMAAVVQNLAGVPDEDVRAIAVYVADVAGTPSDNRRLEAAKALARAKGEASLAMTAPDAGEGASIYAGACAQCHGETGRHPVNPALNLALSSVLRLPRPDNALRIVRGGIYPVEGGAGPVMPGFADALTDDQLIALANYLRTSFAQKPAWTGIETAVRNASRADTVIKQQHVQGARSP